MKPAAVLVDGLSHAVGEGSTSRRLFDGIDFAVHPGESVALIGRSGSGKSTLLNLIAGLEPVRDGSIRLFDRALESLDDHARTLLRRRSIGFVHQAFNLVPTLNVADNITLPLALDGHPADERRARLEPMLEAIGLAGRGDEWPDRLSGGEQQRVALARALIHRPPLILADEPTGNLDAQSGRTVIGLLQRLVEEQGAALLLVTHSLEVASVAARALSLERGRLTAIEPAALAGGATW